MIGRRADAFEPDNDNDITRRQMMAGTAAVGAAGMAATAGVAKVALGEGIPEILSERTHSPEAPFIPWQEKWITTPKNLVGVNVNNDLEWGYIAPAEELNHREMEVAVETEQGTVMEKRIEVIADPSSLPEQLPPIPFHRNHLALVERKKERSKGATDEAEQYALLDRQAAEYHDIFEQQKMRTMDFNGFEKLIGHESKAMKETLAGSYERLAEVYLMPYMDKVVPAEGPMREKAVQSFGKVASYLAGRITPDVMLSYIATEILPAPERAMEMLELLTKNAGVEFLERIPALGDKVKSFGPLQFTPVAIASIVQMLKTIKKEDVLPETLDSFTSIEDHLRAGFLFAFYNELTLIQDTIKDGNPEEIAVILEAADAERRGTSTVILEYLAGAHHRPAIAREIMRDWIRQNRDLPPGERMTTLYTAAGPGEDDQEVATYMKKAQQNALHQKRFKASQLT